MGVLPPPPDKVAEKADGIAARQRMGKVATRAEEALVLRATAMPKARQTGHTDAG
jgi:hypothetical protein